MAQPRTDPDSPPQYGTIVREHCFIIEQSPISPVAAPARAGSPSVKSLAGQCDWRMRRKLPAAAQIFGRFHMTIFRKKMTT
jgi:hypothetical protein